MSIIPHLRPRTLHDTGSFSHGMEMGDLRTDPPSSHRVTAQLEDLLEDGLAQSHFCSWARTGPEAELAQEIEVMLGIKHARKHTWHRDPSDANISGKALKEHAELVQSYRDILESRIHRCADTEAPDKDLCLRLIARLQSHVIRHIEHQYHNTIVNTLQGAQASVKEALLHPEISTMIQNVIDREEDVEAVRWCLEVHDLLISEDCSQCPVQAINTIRNYISRTVTPFHHTSAASEDPSEDEHEVFISLFEHIEEEVKLVMKEAVLRFQQSSQFAMLKTKQAYDPERADVVASDMAKLRERGVTTLVFDFDRTLIPTHVGSIPEERVHEVQITPVARLVMLSALAAGFSVGVASFSDIGDGAGASGALAGERLIRAVLDSEAGLGIHLSAKVQIVAGHPEKMTKRGITCTCGNVHPLPYSKHYHLHKICPGISTHEIRPSSVMLFDDNMGNTVRARQEGLTGVDVDPDTAMSWESWALAMEMSEFIQDPQDEPAWSFAKVQQ